MKNTAFALCVLLSPTILAQECPPPQEDGIPPDPSFDYLIQTEDYWLEAQGVDGAVGDVVPVTISLHSKLANPGWPAIDIAFCHDPAVIEIVGKPIYSEEILALLGPLGLTFMSVDENSDEAGDSRGHGFVLDLLFNPEAYNARFPSDTPLPIMTAFYRVIGVPGQQGQLSFCDAALSRYALRCNYNRIHVYTSDHVQGWDYLSTLNRGDSVRVLDGPATHPDRPPEPPPARVYSERPSPEQVDFRVRIGGAFAAPGAREVPVEVEVSAGVEYSGIQVPIDFDERYLRLVRVKQNFLSGAVVINNNDNTPGPSTTEGYAVIFSGQGASTRRLAAEGEVVKAATLYFDVLDAASEVESTTLSVLTVGSEQALYPAWVGVQHRDGLGVESPIVHSEIDPIVTTSGVLGLRGRPMALRGDSNFDGHLDISDPIVVLNFLFQSGDVPACPNAADFNLDTRLDISDPVSMLGTLFLGLPLPGDSAGPREVPCQ